MMEPAAPGNTYRDHPTLFRRSLCFRLGTTPAVTIAEATPAFSILISTHGRKDVISQTISQTISQNQQTAEVIRRSIRSAMLQNHREQIVQIIEAVSRTRGIEKIRIFDNEVEIITSTLPSEIDSRVDKTAVVRPSASICP